MSQKNHGLFVRMFLLLITLISFSYAESSIWRNDTTYEKGDIVSHNGNEYIAKRFVYQNTPPAVPNAEWFWNVYPEPDLGNLWQNDKEYEAGDTISFKDSLWVAVRHVYQNTPPLASDNGWFWTNIGLGELALMKRDADKIAATLELIYAKVRGQLDTIINVSIDAAYQKSPDSTLSPSFASILATTFCMVGIDTLLNTAVESADWDPYIVGTSEYDVHEVTKLVLKPQLEKEFLDSIDARISRITQPEPPMMRALMSAPTITQDFIKKGALNYVEGHATAENFPEYFGKIKARLTNTHEYAATCNQHDYNKIYQYRIRSGKVEMKEGAGDWHQVPRSSAIGTPVNIAADNNRLFVKTNDNQLWWYTPVGDLVDWPMKLMDLGISAENLEQGVKDNDPKALLQAMAILTVAGLYQIDCFKTHPIENIGFWLQWGGVLTNYAKILAPGFNYEKDWNGKSLGGKGIIKSAEYKKWSEISHADTTWVNLTNFSITINDSTRKYERGNGNGEMLPIQNVSDIAVGHWEGTVATYYVVVNGTVWYLDEELAHTHWTPLTDYTDDWVMKKPDQQFYPIGNRPILNTYGAAGPEIDASNSVLAIATPAQSSPCDPGNYSYNISWIRRDYHQQQDFLYWDLNWCEKSWNSMTLPLLMLSPEPFSFRLNTNSSTLGFTASQAGRKQWDQPRMFAGLFGDENIGFYVPFAPAGVLGHVRPDDVPTYPVSVTLAVNDKDTTIFHVGIDHSNNLQKMQDNGTLVLEKVHGMNDSIVCKLTGELFFKMNWAESAAFTDIYLVTGNETKFLTHFDGYTISKEPISLGKVKLEDARFMIKSYWRSKWWGPIYSDNKSFFRIDLDIPNQRTFTYEDAAAYNMGYDDGSFTVYTK